MVLNGIEPAQMRYITLAEDLEGFLKEKYRKDYNNYADRINFGMKSDACVVGRCTSVPYISPLHAREALNSNPHDQTRIRVM